MKYSACAECETKFSFNICEANISQRSYFTWRSHISLAEGEFHRKILAYREDFSVVTLQIESLAEKTPNCEICVVRNGSHLY